MKTELGPDETELIGSGRLGDQMGLRIEQLMNGYLERVAAVNGGWDILFRDPHDGRLWELTHPQSYIHGGGPRSLKTVSELFARKKYRIP